MSVHWRARPGTLYSQAVTDLTVGGPYPMPPPRPRRVPRRVVLESVPRRDAAQRLSLAFTLLARGQTAQVQSSLPDAAAAGRAGSVTPHPEEVTL